MNFSTKSARFLIVSVCAVGLAVFGILCLKQGHLPPALPHQSAQPVPPQAPMPLSQVAHLETSPQGMKDPAEDLSIAAFRQWAETVAAGGIDQADQARGMELAKARAAEMKELIKREPGKALREALPAELRASLPPAIAAAIEQPVKTSGMASLLMMCSHSSDATHHGCQETPVLLEDGHDWNAHYGDQQWRSHLGQMVEFSGIAVDEELAVRSITPVPTQGKK